MDLLVLIGLEETHTPLHIILIRLVVAAALGALIGLERGSTSGVAGLRTHILIAAALGALIGLERGSTSGVAGLRTHILIALAAALFTTLTFEIYHASLEFSPQQGPDPIRAVEAVTAGIAFLGAGAIFQQRGSVQGLTTGAGMWLAGAVGLSAALGFYIIAAAAALLAVLVLAAMRGFSHKVVSKNDAPPGGD